MSGLFFGLAFGLGGIGSAVLGEVADHHGIPFVFHICSYLPLIGQLTALLQTSARREAGSRPQRAITATQRARSRSGTGSRCQVTVQRTFRWGQ
jgi:hypothetical protein